MPMQMPKAQYEKIKTSHHILSEERSFRFVLDLLEVEAEALDDSPSSAERYDSLSIAAREVANLFNSVFLDDFGDTEPFNP